MDSTLSAFYLCGTKAFKINADVTCSGIALPNTLVIPPGNYSVFETDYELKKEGLYRFCLSTGESQQRIVYRDDAVALLSALTWINSHGTRDDASDRLTLEKIARHGKIVCTCGPFSSFVSHILKDLHIPIRKVGGRTLQKKNGLNDGHILMEVKIEGRWIALETDPGKFYRHHGRRLNLLEYVRQLHKGEYEVELLSKALPLAIGGFTSGGHHLDLWYESLGAIEDSSEELRRAMGVPFIADEGGYYYTTIEEKDRKLAETLWPEPEYRYLPESEFRARFYPEE